MQRRLGNAAARLSHQETRELFLALADEALPTEQKQAVQGHLKDCGECAAGWTRYVSTVELLRGVEREKAPPALASRIMTRVRRQRRHGLKGLHLSYANHRFPVEVLIPLLLAAAVAAYILMASA